MNGEEWVLIHDGYYEVSSFGNVRRAKPGISTFVGRPVLPVIGPVGYQMVCLGGLRTRRAYLHHIVAEAFIGARPDGFVVNHKDGNKQNNHSQNLEYITRKDNAIHAVMTIAKRKGPKKPPREKVGPQRGDAHWTRHKPHLIARGLAMPHCKMSEEQVIEARSRAISGEKQCTLAKEFGISVAQMSRVINGKRRRNI